jgi:hypothetical protein
VFCLTEGLVTSLFWVPDTLGATSADFGAACVLPDEEDGAVRTAAGVDSCLGVVVVSLLDDLLTPSLCAGIVADFRSSTDDLLAELPVRVLTDSASDVLRTASDLTSDPVRVALLVDTAVEPLLSDADEAFTFERCTDVAPDTRALSDIVTFRFLLFDETWVRW